MSELRDYHFRGPLLRRFDDCGEDAKALIGDLLKIWAERRGSNTDISAAYLKAFTDNHVFSGWSSDQEPCRPSRQQPKITDQYVKIGRFNRDLPDPKQENTFGYERTGLARISGMLGVKTYKTPLVRKAGRDAYVRARLDRSGELLIHDYVDEKGRWAPFEYIDFGGQGIRHGKPSIDGLAKAYIRADMVAAHYADDWNKKLAIYLSRVMLFNASHRNLYQPRLEANEVALNINHFLSPARICATWGKRREIIDQLGQAAGTATYYGQAGCNIFSNPPAMDNQSQSQA
ncbi:hypothetical protein PFICI_08282 [Pestalotiopsis fici W106-1]|uniref:Uncharacterized protein n=1 Tax=Pestalotiopsis fici (strain W106-1 / CGMCC3.15140) TaxID=1229662 RepID=W3X3Q4_PESFW|nr:uncharacterized protein PFICI_08282 [Pestalotiopsis fici W106-1]ETS80753.1 hypothetical protein PFICI_08282 [Pestalotiopsis fici W106-1]